MEGSEQRISKSTHYFVNHSWLDSGEEKVETMPVYSIHLNSFLEAQHRWRRATVVMGGLSIADSASAPHPGVVLQMKSDQYLLIFSFYHP